MKSISKEENLISIKDVFQFFYKKFTLLISIFLILTLISLALLLYFKTFIQSDSFSRIDLLIDNKELRKYVEADYILSKKNINEAFRRSNIEIDDVNTSIINSFSLVDGHQEINGLKDYVVNKDFNKFAKELVFDANKEINPLDIIINKINSANELFKTLLINNETLKLSKNALSLIVNNLIDIINENIKIDLSNSNEPGKLSSKVKIIENQILLKATPLEVVKLDLHIDLLKKYIDEIQTKASHINRYINLDSLGNDLAYVRELIRVLVSQNAEVREKFLININAEIAYYDNNTKVLKEIINNYFLTNANNSNDNENNNFNENVETLYETSDSSISLDSSVFNEIIEISNKSKFFNLKAKYIDSLYESEKLKIELQSKKDQYQSEMVIQQKDYDELSKEINNLLSKIVSSLNEYIISYQNISFEKDPIQIVSPLLQEETSLFSNINDEMILILLGSFFLSFSSIVILGVQREFK